MTLYIKHRPVDLLGVKGNEDIVAALENMLLNKDSCPHSFLLHGPTGCGKTTIARIIAKELGCAGSDYKEIDSADFRGIDTVREISKQCMYKPLEGAVRVFVVDECHKLTGDAQNAFLKRLEDTPSHVYFILCTTEPNKLLPTIRGRCSQFQVKQLNEKTLLRLLRQVVTAEEETLEQEIYDIIIQDSLGHPRNALTILEQVLSVPAVKRLKMAKQGLLEQSQSIDLCQLLIKPGTSWKPVSVILQGLKDQDPEGIRRQVLGYAQAVLLKSDDVRAGLIMEEFLEPTYNSGFPQIVFACYTIIKS